MTLPPYEFLSAPLWLITVLHVLTLSLHFVAMNLVVGGIVAVLWGKMTDRWEHPTVKLFLKLLPSAMATTVTLGVAPLLFVQLVYPRQVYSASVISGWFWILIVPAVIVVYYALYAASFSKAEGAGRRKLYYGVAFVGMLYVSLVYSATFDLAERPELAREIYASTQSGIALNTGVLAYLPRWLHMLLGALTVGGFFVGLFGRAHEDAFKAGKTFFLWGLIGASVMGLVYVGTLGEHLRPFMKSPGIWILTVSVVLSLGSAHLFFKKKFVPAGTVLFLSLVGMVATRHVLRLVRLEGHFDPSTTPVDPQWSVFLIFLVCFVAMLGMLVWMLRLYFNSRPAASE